MWCSSLARDSGHVRSGPCRPAGNGDVPGARGGWPQIAQIRPALALGRDEAGMGGLREVRGARSSASCASERRRVGRASLDGGTRGPVPAVPREWWRPRCRAGCCPQIAQIRPALALGQHDAGMGELGGVRGAGSRRGLLGSVPFAVSLVAIQISWADRPVASLGRRNAVICEICVICGPPSLLRRMLAPTSVEAEESPIHVPARLARPLRSPLSALRSPLPAPRSPLSAIRRLPPPYPRTRFPSICARSSSS
jgi:hypothetical protein